MSLYYKAPTWRVGQNLVQIAKNLAKVKTECAVNHWNGVTEEYYHCVYKIKYIHTAWKRTGALIASKVFTLSHIMKSQALMQVL